MDDLDRYLLDIFEKYHKNFINDLKELDYELNEAKTHYLIFKNRINNAEICIEMLKDYNIIVNYKDCYGNKYYICNWYLGTKDGVNVDDIFEVINSEKFKIFTTVKEDKVVKVDVKQYIINYLTSIGYLLSNDIKTFNHLYVYNDDKDKRINICINDNQIFISIYGYETKDYIFSKRFQYDIIKEDLDILLQKIKKFTIYFLYLF